MVAKARGSVADLAQCIDHLRQHVANLLGSKPGLANSKEPTP